MKLFSKLNQIFLFLVFIAHQNAIAVPLTKAEAENGRLMNGNIGRIITALQRDPRGAELLLKSAAVMIKSLEQLGKKDPSSPFAQDAQSWREAIGGLGLLSKGKDKIELIDSAKIAAAKNEVDRSLDAIKNPEPLKRFVIKEQKESIAINESKAIKSAETELRLLAADKKQLLSRAEEIKEEYKEAIVEYRKKNQQALKKQLGFAIDVSKEVASFNTRIDAIVKDILKKQRESKRKQPGGLSLEDKIDEFNDFVADQIQLGQERSLVDTKPLTKDEKNSIDQQLFTIIADVFASLDNNNSEEKTKIVDDIRQKAMDIVDAQFEKTGGLFGFLTENEDKERKEKVNKKLNEMVANLLESVQLQDAGQKDLAAEEEVGVEQDNEQQQEEEIEIPLMAPKRPPSSKKSAVEQLSQSKKQQQEVPAQSAEQEKLTERTFATLMQHIINNADHLYDEDKKQYEDEAIKRAKAELLKSPIGERAEAFKLEYGEAIKAQAEKVSHPANWEDDLSSRKESFNNRLDEVVKEVAGEQKA